MNPDDDFVQWYPFGNGTSIGLTGSDNGIIVEDLEHQKGARITIEKNCDIAPFAVTVSIYGLLFHNVFSRNIEDAKTKMEVLKQKVENVFTMFETTETEKNNLWYDRFNEIMQEIGEVN